MKKTITPLLLTLVFGLEGCSSYKPSDQNGPDDYAYANRWCDPENLIGYSSGSATAEKNSSYYEFHADSRYKSKEECMDNYRYGTSGSSPVNRKQLDDGLDEQLEEKNKRDRSR